LWVARGSNPAPWD